MNTISELQSNIGNNENIIQKQIKYIDDLKNYSRSINQAINGKCVTGITSDYTIDDIRGNCSTSQDGACSTICGDVSFYHNKIKQGGSSYVNLSNYSSGNTSNNDYNAIMSNNREIQKLRNELDLKLKDLNGTPDSRFKTYEDAYNYELIMNVTWSILATSIIYYVFVKL